jgi:hypothetical protein
LAILPPNVRPSITISLESLSLSFMILGFFYDVWLVSFECHH